MVHMKVRYKIIREMGQDNLNSMMVIFTKDNGKMIKNTVQEY